VFKVSPLDLLILIFTGDPNYVAANADKKEPCEREKHHTQNSPEKWDSEQR